MVGGTVAAMLAVTDITQLRKSMENISRENDIPVSIFPDDLVLPCTIIEKIIKQINQENQCDTQMLNFSEFEKAKGDNYGDHMGTDGSRAHLASNLIIMAQI